MTDKDCSNTNVLIIQFYSVVCVFLFVIFNKLK